MLFSIASFAQIRDSLVCLPTDTVRVDTTITVVIEDTLNICEDDTVRIVYIQCKTDTLWNIVYNEVPRDTVCEPVIIDDSTMTPPPDPPLIGLWNFDIDFYVDFQGGNDSNNGKTPSTAWKTITKVNGSGSLFNSELSSDTCVIAFKRGGVWRQQLNAIDGNSNHPIVYTSYGSGRKPRLLCSDDARGSTSDWTNLGSNIWQRSFSSSGSIIISFERNGWYGWGDDVDLSSTNISYTDNDGTIDNPFEFGFGNNLLKVYAVTNPAIYYEAIEKHQRSTAISCGDDSYVWIDGLELAYAKAPSDGLIDAIGNGTNLWLTRNEWHHVGDPNEPDDGECHFIYAMGDNMYIAYNKGWESADHGYMLYNYGNVSSNNVIVEHNFCGSTHYTAFDFASNNHNSGAMNVSNWDIRFNTLSDSGKQISFSSNAGFQFLGTGYPNDNPCYFLNYRVYGNIVLWSSFALNKQRMADNVYYYNNTIVLTGGYSDWQTEGRNNDASVTVKNNLFIYSSSSSSDNYFRFDDACNNYIFDNNMFWDLDGSTQIDGGNISTWNAKPEVGTDILANPNFIQFTGTSDIKNLNLSVGSPAIDTGLDLGNLYEFEYDMNGVLRSANGKWNIGALE